MLSTWEFEFCATKGFLVLAHTTLNQSSHRGGIHPGTSRCTPALGPPCGRVSSPQAADPGGAEDTAQADERGWTMARLQKLDKPVRSIASAKPNQFRSLVRYRFRVLPTIPMGGRAAMSALSARWAPETWVTAGIFQICSWRWVFIGR
jgi:hypothetical protein